MLQDGLPRDHLVWLYSELVGQFDLSNITHDYVNELCGHPTSTRPSWRSPSRTHPCRIPPSRTFGRRCLEDVAFRVLPTNNTPDFRTDSHFRKHRAEVERNLLGTDLRLTDTDAVQLEALVQGRLGASRPPHPYGRRCAAGTARWRLDGFEPLTEKMHGMEGRQPPVSN